MGVRGVEGRWALRLEVLAVELGDEGVESLLVGLDGDGGKEGLDVLSRGGGL